jgi:hypothetical protein
MVNVDTVYQKVLALANKEQRGYITPQDFNLFANQAQLELFEQYFYDVNMARKGQGNDTVYADVDDMLEEKLQIFEQNEAPSTSWVSNGTNQFILPNYIYRVHRVNIGTVSAEILNTKDFNDCMEGGILLNPTNGRPVTNIRNNIIRCVGTSNTNILPTNIWFFRIPNRVNWTYVVINKQAMYDANASTLHFELHPSEENQLINKILTLSGVANQQPDLMKAGQGMEMMTIKQQPKI